MEDSFTLIRELSLFTGFTDREMNILAAVMRPRRLAQGEELCREGDKGASFFIAVRGRVEVVKQLSTGGEERLTEVGPNNILGQISLIDGRPRSATLRALTPALVLECSRDDFDRLFWAGSPFAFKILDMTVVQLSRRLRDANRELRQLYENPTETLLKLHEQAMRVHQAAEDQEEFERKG